MITRVVYNNKAFKIVGSYGFKFSNNEVTFNDITIDFTGCTIADMPFKYQEIKIIEAENEENIMQGEVKFTGFLDDIDLSDMKLEEEEREITLTLLSPLKLATKRNVTLVGTYEIEEAIKRILQPLVDDGFTIKEINVPGGQITTNFVLDTVENCMNNIGFKRNIFWYIDEKKEILVNSIDYMFGLKPKKNIKYKENGLISMQPHIENTDYANVINFKNVRMIYSSYATTDEKDESGFLVTEHKIVNVPKGIKKGDVVTFNYPIIIDEKYAKQYLKEHSDTTLCSMFYIYITLKNGSKKKYDIHFNSSLICDSSITFSDDSDEEGDIVLQRDSFFKNMITGFKWNLDTEATIEKIGSDLMLKYTTMRFMYSSEIDKLKGIISESGQIEKSIDYDEKWTSLQQIINYARSLMSQNTNTVNQVTLNYDKNPNLEIGDTVKIDNSNFYINGQFVVKEKTYTYNSEEDQNWQIILKASDFISSYIDLFRPAEVEENEDKIDTIMLSEFIEEEIKEIHKTELNNDVHTLNFNLEG